MKRILITGASGFLGSNFCHLYADQFEILALFNSHNLQAKNAKGYQVDITDADAVKKFFMKIEPDAVIHLAAYSDPNQCQLHPSISEKVNIEGSENLAYLCRDAKVPLLFTSTDLVFDGDDAPYKESDIPAPVSIYGLHKSIAEQSILDIYPQATVCRLPLMYGLAFTENRSFLQPMLEKLSLGEPLNLFTDEFRSVASAKDVCEGMVLCLEHPGAIFHLGGLERISRYEFGKLVCQVFGFDADLIVAGKQKDVPMPAPRPKDVSLSSDKSHKIGWRPASIMDNLEHIKIEMQQAQ